MVNGSSIEFSASTSGSSLRGLRGSSKVENSRHNVLQQAKEDRERRKYERMLPKAALQIQKCYRAWRVRRALQSRLQVRLDEALGCLHGDSMELDECLYSISPLVFAIYLPFDYRDPDRCGEVDHVTIEPNLLSAFLALFHQGISSPMKNKSMYWRSNIIDEHELCKYAEDILHCTKKMVLLCSGILGRSNSSVVARCAAARIVFILSDDSFWNLKCLLATSDGHRMEGSDMFACLMRWWGAKSSIAAATARFWNIIMSSKDLKSDVLIKNAVADACRSQIHVSTCVGGETSKSICILVENILTLPHIVQYSDKIVDSLSHEGVLVNIAHGFCNGAVDLKSSLACARVMNNCTAAMTGEHVLGNNEAIVKFFLNLSNRIAESGDVLTEGEFDQLRVGSVVTMFFKGFPSIQEFVTLYYNITSVLSPRSSIIGYIGCDESMMLSMWRELSQRLRTPMQLQKGETHVIIKNSLHSISHDNRALFYIFTTSYTEYIRYIDDLGFHCSDMLGFHRAIAVAMNCILFHTFVPIDGCSYSEDHERNTLKFVSDMKSTVSSLVRTLFEKNERHPFCESEMWVLPYKNAMQRNNGSGFDSDSILNAFENMKVEVDSKTPMQIAKLPGILSLLFIAPSIVSFSTRVEVFRTGLVLADRTARRYHLSPAQGGPRPIQISVRRDRMLEDVLSQVGGSNLGCLKRPLSVTFISKDGLQEAGIDMGGLTKELLTLTMKEICDPNRGIFCAASTDGSLYPSPLSSSMLGEERAIELLQLAGALLGKALYESFLLQAPLSTFFIRRLLGDLPNIDDLESVDPQLYRNLLQLKQYPREVVDNLGLYFTAEMDICGYYIEEDLIPNGGEEMVTFDNRLRYISLLADWHLRKRLDTASTAFMKGLSTIFSPSWLRIFSPKEINMLLGGGTDGHIDIQDLKTHCLLAGGYTQKSRPIRLFWKVLATMDQDTIRKLLKFATATTAAPLGGFKYMNPPFCIQQAASELAHPAIALFGGSKERLPSASTCPNTLRLPPYMREKTMREKLLYAIQSEAGFDLS